jgi:hypothetical protein
VQALLLGKPENGSVAPVVQPDNNQARVGGTDCPVEQIAASNGRAGAAATSKGSSLNPTTHLTRLNSKLMRCAARRNSSLT